MAIQIGIDGRSLKGGPPGVATVVTNLLANIPELVPFDSKFPVNNFLWNQFRVPLATLRRKWNLYHAPSYTAPLINFCPTVLSVHDVSYLASDEWYPYKLDRSRKRFYISSMKRATRILVPSEFSRQEVLRFLPELEPRLRRVYLGVSADFRLDAALADTVRRKLKLPDRFLLHVGDIHPRRNVDQIQAVAKDSGIPLVLVGRILEGSALKDSARYLLTDISRQELVGIYNAATALVYASIYEGFGLPLLEAMACGLPVVAASRSSIPEVCGEAAVLVEPETKSLLAGVGRILESREEYVKRGLERIRHKPTC